jgi:UDP-glucose 4-epimerase
MLSENSIVRSATVAARFQHRNVLVTGGLGFIGSNLALQLAREGATVTVIDSLDAGCGGNRANVDASVHIVEADIAEPDAIREIAARAHYIFNLAGEISHIHSMQYPERDLQINTVAQLRFLQMLTEVNPGVRVIYAGTRQIFGRPRYLPVDEKHPVQPVDFNGVHKYAAAMYHQMLTDQGLLDAVVLRLTNVYGPRMAVSVWGQGFLGEFFRRALAGEDYVVLGDGEQLRDPLYVDDAVEAFLLAALKQSPESRTYNVGGPEKLSLRSMADTLARQVGVAVNQQPFPEELRRIDIGSYWTSSERILAELGWQPRVPFQEGARRTLEFLAAHRAEYLPLDDPQPRRLLPEHTGRVRRLRFDFRHESR